MPRKGRPRLVSSKASGTKLFVDDLREVVKLAQVERGGTVSDVIRELVHEALTLRRLKAMGRDAAEEPLRRIQQQAVSEGISPLEQEIKEIKAALAKLVTNGHLSGDSAKRNPEQSSPLLADILGFAVTAESKVHLLLQNFLLARGLGEEAVRKLLTEHEEKSRRRTEKIVAGLTK
ncbi:MAG: hypothetical protein AB7U82_35675 [Blastocatellales bacterium]